MSSTQDPSASGKIAPPSDRQSMFSGQFIQLLEASLLLTGVQRITYIYYFTLRG